MMVRRRAAEEANFRELWKAGETKEPRPVVTEKAETRRVATVACAGGGYLTSEVRRLFL